MKFAQYVQVYPNENFVRYIVGMWHVYVKIWGNVWLHNFSWSNIQE